MLARRVPSGLGEGVLYHGRPRDGSNPMKDELGVRSDAPDHEVGGALHVESRSAPCRFSSVFFLFPPAARRRKLILAMAAPGSESSLVGKTRGMRYTASQRTYSARLNGDVPQYSCPEKGIRVTPHDSVSFVRPSRKFGAARPFCPFQGTGFGARHIRPKVDRTLQGTRP